MGRRIGFLCLVAGLVVCAASLGLLPSEYVTIDAPRGLVLAGGVLLTILGVSWLARDHRGSEALTALLVLAFALIAGWATFLAPEGTIQRYIPFIPASVNEAVARLLFGLAAVLCIGMAAWALRRLLR